MRCLSLGTRPVVDMTSSRSQHSVIIIIVKLTRIFLAQISYVHGTWKRELLRSLQRFGSWFVCHRNDSWGDIRMKISSRWNENLACSWPGQREIPVKRNRLGWGKNNNWSTAKINDDRSQERSPKNLQKAYFSQIDHLMRPEDWICNLRGHLDQFTRHRKALTTMKEITHGASWGKLYALQSAIIGDYRTNVLSSS